MLDKEETKAQEQQALTTAGAGAVSPNRSKDEEMGRVAVDEDEKYFEDSTSLEFDMVDLEANDEILHAKMKLINDAIDEIGFTPYHLKLFFFERYGILD